MNYCGMNRGCQEINEAELRFDKGSAAHIHGLGALCDCGIALLLSQACRRVSRG